MKIAVIGSGSKKGKFVDELVSFTDAPADQDVFSRGEHGTLVAAIIRRACPKAKIAMIQVAKKNASGNHEVWPGAVETALYWCVEQQYQLVNMSFNVKEHPGIRAAIERFRGLVVVASGNRRPGRKDNVRFVNGKAYRHTGPTKALFPANMEETISVGELKNEAQEEADIFEDGRFRCSSGSSFACPRITARIAHFYNLGLKKEEVLKKLRNQ